MRRLLVVVIAVALAITAGLLFLSTAGLMVTATRELAVMAIYRSMLAVFDAWSTVEGPTPFVALAAASFVGLVTAILVLPPIIVAAVGEVSGIRSYVWYAGGAGVLAAAIAWYGHPASVVPDGADTQLLMMLFLTGTVAGFVYWSIAGRNAGLRRPTTAPA
jgi:hypothetical protein